MRVHMMFMYVICMNDMQPCYVYAECMPQNSRMHVNVCMCKNLCVTRVCIHHSTHAYTRSRSLSRIIDLDMSYRIYIFMLQGRHSCTANRTMLCHGLFSVETNTLVLKGNKNNYD